MSNSNRTLSNEVTLESLEENKYYKLKNPITFEDPTQAWYDYQNVQEELNLLARDYHRLIEMDDTTLVFEFLPGEVVSVEQIIHPNERSSANVEKFDRDVLQINLNGLPDGEDTIFLKRVASNRRANKRNSANQEGGAWKKSVKRRNSVKRRKSRKSRKSSRK